MSSQNRRRQHRHPQAQTGPTFMESLWSHSRQVPTGQTYFVPVVDHIPGYGSRVVDQEEYEETKPDQHYGKKQYCKRCRRLGNNMGDFSNSITGRGFMFYGGATVVVVGTVMAIPHIARFMHWAIFGF